MTDHEIDALVAQANPIDERALTALCVRDAEIALGEALLCDDDGSGSAPPPRRRPRRTLLAGLAVAALAVVAFVALTGRDAGPSGTAWAAPLVHLAESSPLLLLDRPGWSVGRADETDEVEGEMSFIRGGTDDANTRDARDRVANLHWRRGTLEHWQRSRAAEAAFVVRRTVLGNPAQVSQYPEYNAIRDFTAIWRDGSRVLEFRAVASDLAAFERLLGSLKRVDVGAWLSAMPASVIKAANSAGVIKAMLADIPLPPGFDRAAVESQVTVKDHYQLGAKVTGAVACAWIDRWAAARERGDDDTAQAAIDAMQTSHRWKVLEQMKSEGAWTQVLREYADAMRGDGDWSGRPLHKEVRSGLGCGYG